MLYFRIFPALCVHECVCARVRVCVCVCYACHWINYTCETFYHSGATTGTATTTWRSAALHLTSKMHNKSTTNTPDYIAYIYYIYITILYDRCKSANRAKGVGGVGRFRVWRCQVACINWIMQILSTRRAALQSISQPVSHSFNQLINQSIVESVAKHMGKSSIWPKRVELRFNASHEPKAICIWNRKSRLERAVCIYAMYIV